MLLTAVVARRATAAEAAVENLAGAGRALVDTMRRAVVRETRRRARRVCMWMWVGGVGSGWIVGSDEKGYGQQTSRQEKHVARLPSTTTAKTAPMNGKSGLHVLPAVRYSAKSTTQYLRTTHTI